MILASIQIGKYHLEFYDRPELYRYEEYSSPDYYGIKFFVDGEEYDLMCHRYLGERLLIKSKDGNRDMPLNEGTFEFLPFWHSVAVDK